MAITKRVQRELEQATPVAATATRETSQSRRRRPTPKQKKSSPIQLTEAQRDAVAERSKGKAWSPVEHQRFLDALDLFPSGPWKAIADYVGTKNSRQTMTHAQKYREKHERHSRGLRTKSRKKKSKKPTAAKVPTRRTPRRRASRTTYDEEEATDEDEECSERHTKRRKLDSASPQEETHSRCEDNSLVKADTDLDADDDINDDFLSAFGDTCDVDAASMPTASSQSLPCVSSLTLPESLIFASVDLWHSQSLAEMELCDVDGGSTDLEDPAEFAIALSQECW